MAPTRDPHRRRCRKRSGPRPPEARGLPGPGFFQHWERRLSCYRYARNVPPVCAVMSHSKNRVAQKKRAATMPSMQDTPGNFVDSRDFARIAKAIRFIDEHFREQPSLEDVAAHAGLSEFHFNRLFR